MTAITNIVELQLIKYNLFKTQNPEIGKFDVIFEIKEKLLYAHKNLLNLVSETFDSMLSERWTSKNESIKIEDYTFDEFYQFLTFLYSGECQLTTENIYSMIDIAEFYQIQCFKNYCDAYISNEKMNDTNIFAFLKLAMKYSLTELHNSAKRYVAKHFANIARTDDFLMLDICSVKDIIISSMENAKQEDLFQAVFKWTEKQVMDNKEKSEEDPNYNLNDAIKSEISQFLLYINFSKMKLTFMLEFVVPRGFIFASLDELSKILRGACPKNKVTVTNAIGQTLSGKISSDDRTLIKMIESFKLSANTPVHRYLWWNPIAEFPSKESSLKKRSDVDWYLVYFPRGDIGITREINDSYYLIAEMFPENGKEFFVTTDAKIELSCDY